MSRRILLIASLALAAATFAPPAPALAHDYQPGIDVSHWNGTIDWKRVAAAGTKFAIAKATEGQTFVDPKYSDYKKWATTNGLKFTAYHFARPDTTSNDAVIEANHFVDVSRLAPGHLIPALDLEAGRGLPVKVLKAWVWGWLRQVEKRLGVKPMIYSGPNFWKNHMGDTSEFADAGYRILWIAHWYVDKPTVPGKNWGGRGWTFWQWTDCGKVPGVDGCVDRDWFRWKSFWGVTIH